MLSGISGPGLELSCKIEVSARQKTAQLQRMELCCPARGACDFRCCHLGCASYGVPFCWSSPLSMAQKRESNPKTASRRNPASRCVLWVQNRLESVLSCSRFSSNHKKNTDTSRNSDDLFEGRITSRQGIIAVGAKRST